MRQKILVCLVIFMCVIGLVGASLAVEDCCGINSPGNPFKCGPSDDDPGNCVWYAAHKRPKVIGVCNEGNASAWFDSAQNGGLPTGQVPGIGSIAVFNWYKTISGVKTNVGHVAYVESVNPDGSFNVSEMGWGYWDCVHYGTYTKNSFDGLIGFIFPGGPYVTEFISSTGDWNLNKGETLVVDCTAENTTSDQVMNIEMIAIAVHDKDGKVMDPSVEAIYDNGGLGWKLLQPGEPIFFPSTAIDINALTVGEYQLIVKAEMNGEWKHLHEEKLTIRELIYTDIKIKGMSFGDVLTPSSLIFQLSLAPGIEQGQKGDWFLVAEYDKKYYSCVKSSIGCFFDLNAQCQETLEWKLGIHPFTEEPGKLVEVDIFEIPLENTTYPNWRTGQIVFYFGVDNNPNGKLDGDHLFHDAVIVQIAESPTISNWVKMDSGVDVYLSDIWGDSPDNVYVVGDKATILHYDGTKWSQLTDHINLMGDPYAIQQTEISYLFQGIWGQNGGLYVVGNFGSILIYDGTDWSLEELTWDETFPNGIVQTIKPYFWNIWGDPISNEIFATGIYDLVAHHNGSGWTVVDIPIEDLSLTSIWGVDSNNVYALGLNGEVLFYDGNDWSEITSPSLGYYPCGGFAGATGEKVILGGASLYIYHYDDSGWEEKDSNQGQGGYSWLRAVHGSSEDNFYAVGYDGTVLHHRNDVWEKLDSGITDNLHGVWVSPDGSEVFAVGDNGTILHGVVQP